jgi:DNA-binding transcriptional regulator YdaS (Cro superfamily)
LVTGFVDQNLTPKLEAEVRDMKHDLATVSTARDEAKAKSADIQSRLTQAKSEQEQLQKEIEEKKNSDTYIFSQIMKVRAGGDLAAAHHQLTDFLAKFPTGSLTAAAQAQLTQVDGELAAREAQKKQAEADAAVAAAQARADLLARAGKGEVTLSEMRQALIGKTPLEVSALFGTPNETASNRWGYGRPMVFNPLTNEKFGLTVNFNAGIVQGVDYYYQPGGGK